jgi:hypothetical protein
MRVKLEPMRRTLAATLLLVSCAHEAPRTAQTSTKAESANDILTEVSGDTLTRTFDLNHDSKPDDWKTFKLLPDPSNPGKTIEVLIKRELDSNFDGKPDITTWYNEDGTKAREAFDFDFDGQVDVVNTWEMGMLVRKDTFHGGTKPDQVAYYEGGKKVRVERDARGTGKVDTWEYFENGKLQRIGEDLDGDGIVDRWTKAKGEEEPPAATAAATPPAPAPAPAAKKK